MNVTVEQGLATAFVIIVVVLSLAIWSLTRPDRRPDILQPPPESPTTLRPVDPWSPRLTDRVAHPVTGAHAWDDGPTEQITRSLRILCACTVRESGTVEWHPACPLHGLK